MRSLHGREVQNSKRPKLWNVLAWLHEHSRVQRVLQLQSRDSQPHSWSSFLPQLQCWIL